MIYRLIFVGLCLIFGFVYSDDKVQCKDENGNTVDWFVMYKINKQSMASEPLIRDGLAYVYITSATVTTGWQMTKKGLNSETAMLSNTLSPIYNTGGKKNIRVLYNDHRPDSGAVGTRGHTKGVVIANANEGFWLVHSVPAFPIAPPDGVPTKYSYPESGKKYAQSFLCISVQSDQIETIAGQLYFNQAISYYARSTQSLQTKYPTLVKVVEGKFKSDPPYFNKAVIRSTAGLAFTSFAKSDKWLKELYHDYVAPQLGTPLYVQTWRNGVGKLDSNCAGNAVYNIKSVVMKITGVSIDTINSGSDHSKWCISKGSGTNGNWVCIGDINRASTQESRGGGTVCVKSPQLWKSYSAIVNEYEHCH